ncbi:hypothetical protein I6G77_27940 (plasmid) [Bacillus tropicus]|uniref:DUF1878 family protein n=1 Tax=Bacillus tropicus TaxID=2026188 RepID=A0A7T2V8H5_9BACI|nr:hypothetical protein [Bacillus tropicus]AJG91276.1 hypothetical protein BG03_5677 [Bacillus cereus]QPR80647.1 hypothetical protein I6G77_27940 [Bacillus tropicus]
MNMNEYSVELEDVKKMLELYLKLKDTDIFKEFYEEELELIKIERLQKILLMVMNSLKSTDIYFLLSGLILKRESS